jgi:Domain of unknown function (DUF4159)
MFRSSNRLWRMGLVVLSLMGDLACGQAIARAGVTSEEVEQAIRHGVKFLKERQRADGSWPDAAQNAPTGSTSLVALALLTAGEQPDSPTIERALTFLRRHAPHQLNSTYAIGLQTMVYAAADPETDRARMVANVDWLERAQHKDPRRELWPGNWSYTEVRAQAGDNSNTQYALLGLNAANEAGIPVRPEVWALSRAYFEHFQNRDGGWGYTPRNKQSTASMTCAGIASLIFCGSRRFQSLESLHGESIHHCGEGVLDPFLNRGIDWLANHFDVHQNLGHGQQYKIYYLYGLERAGRLSGVRFFGQNDWYRMGAEELVHTQNKLSGYWSGPGENEIVGTSLALLFLAKGRAPVLINKLSRPPRGDWNKDADDVRNMVSVVSREWKHLLTWQVVDPNSATIQDMLQAPIAFFNGHNAPEFSVRARQNLRAFIEQGGFIFAEACCGSTEFDQGFKRLVKEIFPEDEYRLRPLSPEHAVWRAKYLLNPEIHPLWGVEHGCRTVLIYSPQDLSCYWNQVERSPTNPAVIKAFRVGENVIDYATGREMPADKLTIRDVHDLKGDAPRRGALRIAKLRYAGDWNIAPQAIPNLMEALRGPPLRYDVVISQKDLFARDPNLIYYPLVYVHGRTALQLDPDDLRALRRHLDPGGGTLFVDAACGSASFDASFRKLVAEILPDRPLVPIPAEDELYSARVGFDLKDVQYTEAAGGRRGFPQLEGVKLNDHWAIIYSKYDIGCALERHTGMDCKGYTHSSAARIAANIVIYATLP